MPRKRDGFTKTGIVVVPSVRVHEIWQRLAGFASFFAVRLKRGNVKNEATVVLISGVASWKWADGLG